MTKETRTAVKAELFKGYREKAVAEFRKFMPEGRTVEDTWEGVMSAVDYVLDRADRAGERSGAVMAAAMWMHGYLEEDTYCKVNRMSEIVDAEVAAASGDKAPGTTPTPAPAASVR